MLGNRRSLPYLRGVTAELATHVDKASNYIGSANLAAQENPAIQPTVHASLAQAEAFLALADAVDRLATAVRAVGGLPPDEDIPKPYWR